MMLSYDVQCHGLVTNVHPYCYPQCSSMGKKNSILWPHHIPWGVQYVIITN